MDRFVLVHGAQTEVPQSEQQGQGGDGGVKRRLERDMHAREPDRTPSGGGSLGRRSRGWRRDGNGRSRVTLNGVTFPKARFTAWWDSCMAHRSQAGAGGEARSAAL